MDRRSADDDQSLYWRVGKATDQTGLPPSWFYQRSSKGLLPGARRAGKYLVIKVDEFLSALESGSLK